MPKADVYTWLEFLHTVYLIHFFLLTMCFTLILINGYFKDTDVYVFILNVIKG